MPPGNRVYAGVEKAGCAMALGRCIFFRKMKKSHPKKCQNFGDGGLAFSLR